MFGRRQVGLLFWPFWICIFFPGCCQMEQKREKTKHIDYHVLSALSARSSASIKFFTYTRRRQNYQVTLKSYQFPHDLRQVMPPDYTQSLNRNDEHPRQSYRPHRPLLITRPPIDVRLIPAPPSINRSSTLPISALPLAACTRTNISFSPSNSDLMP